MHCTGLTLGIAGALADGTIAARVQSSQRSRYAVHIAIGRKRLEHVLWQTSELTCVLATYETDLARVVIVGVAPSTCRVDKAIVIPCNVRPAFTYRIRSQSHETSSCLGNCRPLEPAAAYIGVADVRYLLTRKQAESNLRVQVLNGTHDSQHVVTCMKNSVVFFGLVASTDRIQATVPHNTQ